MRLLLVCCYLFTSLTLAAVERGSSLDVTLQLAKQHGYYADRVDWPQIETKAKLLLTSRGEPTAIRFVLEALGDRHSSYIPPTGETADAVKNSNQKSEKLLSETRTPVAGIPVIRILAWSGTSQQAMAVTRSLREQLNSVLSVPRCGIILDFSNNRGGNMWPTLVGLSPLLTEGLLGSFKSAQGEAWLIEKWQNKIFYRGESHNLNSAITEQPTYPARRIAIIVGPFSASSGEIVPILLQGQQNVRVFGQPTAGLATANTSFSLPNGGSVNITTALTVDRHGEIVETRLMPDEETLRPLETAANWVMRQCQSGGALNTHLPFGGE